MDYATLKSLKPGEFEGAADGYRTMSNMAKASKDRIDNEIIAKLNKELEGDALTAAVGQLRKLSKNFHYAQTECGLISTSLNALASDLREAKKKLDAAVEDAHNEGFTVKSDGSVSYPAGGDKVDGKKPEGGTATGRTGNDSDTFVGDNANDQANALERQASNLDPNPHSGPAQQYANRIAKAVKEATEADHKWAPKLRELMADDDLTVSSKDWADAQKDMTGVQRGAKDYLDDIKDPPKGGSPKDNAEWWKGLPQKEKDDYVSVHPASIGKMDGLPSEARDEANRTVLATERAKADIDLKEHLKHEPEMNKGGSGLTYYRNPEWTDWDRKRSGLQKTIRSLDGVEDSLTGRSGNKRPYLLGVDSEKGGKAIVALGDPDTADHTAVQVPGTATDLSSVPGQVSRIDRMHDSASAQAGPGETVSTISWLGYDAPEIDDSVTNQSRAKDAAPDLQNFTEGTRAAHKGPDSHLTVVGHSYGSTTVGAAASQGNGLGADDIISLGSPGMTVEHAKDLQTDPHHVWIGATKQDPIVRQTSGLTLGPNPAMEEFGAQPMAVNDGGHSSYWDKDKQSLDNQGRIIAGVPPVRGVYYKQKPVDLGPDGHSPIIRDE